MEKNRLVVDLLGISSFMLMFAAWFCTTIKANREMNRRRRDAVHWSRAVGKVTQKLDLAEAECTHLKGKVEGLSAHPGYKVSERPVSQRVVEGGDILDERSGLTAAAPRGEAVHRTP